jgi:kinesin family protein 11
LGRDFKSIFENLVKHLSTQQAEADELRKQLAVATASAMRSETQISDQLQILLDEEREQAAKERQLLLAQVTNLVNTAGSTQEARLSQKVQTVRSDINSTTVELQLADKLYTDSMDVWSKKETLLVDEVLKSRDTLKGKLKRDWTTVTDHNTSIQATTRSVHEETVRIVDTQMKDMATQMQALDEFVTRARSQNESHHTSHLKSLRGLSSSVQQAYTQTQDRLRSSNERIQAFDVAMDEESQTLQDSLLPLDEDLRHPLSDLRDHVLQQPLTEYISTGETPQKTQYTYPTSLPQTASHEQLLADRMSSSRSTTSAGGSEILISPSKSIVYADAPDDDLATTRPSTVEGGLREIHVNVNAGMPRGLGDSTNVKPELETISLSSSLMGPPPLKRHATMDSKLPRGGRAGVVRSEGRENVPPSGGRRLRSSPPS